MNIIEGTFKAAGEIITFAVKVLATPFAWLGYVWKKDYQERMTDLYKPTLLTTKEKGIVGMANWVLFMLLKIQVFILQLVLIVPSIIIWFIIFKDPIPYIMKYFESWIKR